MGVKDCGLYKRWYLFKLFDKNSQVGDLVFDYFYKIKNINYIHE